MITILGQPVCSDTIRCMQHCELLNLRYKTKLLFTHRKEAMDPRYIKDLELPQVIVGDENIGGFLELIKRYPI